MLLSILDPYCIWLAHNERELSYQTDTMSFDGLGLGPYKMWLSRRGQVTLVANNCKDHDL